MFKEEYKIRYFMLNAILGKEIGEYSHNNHVISERLSNKILHFKGININTITSLYAKTFQERQ